MKVVSSIVTLVVFFVSLLCCHNTFTTITIIVVIININVNILVRYSYLWFLKVLIHIEIDIYKRKGNRHLLLCILPAP